FETKLAANRVKDERLAARRAAAAVVDHQQDSEPTRTAYGDFDTYPDGSIIKIIYCNFLTYDYSICVPGPRLNVIIGTNGSGKSTIICGICLALGGSPKSLGRSERLGDYIKHGTQEGYVELHLKDGVKGTQVLKIHIKQPTTAQFYHNDKPITQRDLKTLVQSYNIQVDNLCTFLAQDKVKSFSEQSPQELLENTLKAASTTLLDERNKLIARQKEEGNMEKKIDETKKTLKKVDAESETLIPRVQNYLKKQEMQSRLTLITRKKALVVLNSTQAMYEREKEKVKELKEMVDKSHRKLELKTAEFNALERQRGTFDSDMNKAKAMIKSAKQNYDTCNMTGDYLAEKTTLERDYLRTKERADKWESERKSLEQQLDAQKGTLNQAMDELKGYNEANGKYQNEMRKIKLEEDQIDEEFRNITRERDNIRREKQQLQESWNEIEKYDHRRFNVLKQRYNQSGAGAAWEYYLNHKDEFEAPVYVPILHMKVPNPKDNIYLENLIANRDYAMFIFGSKNDERRLMRAGQWRIASTVVQPRDARDFSTDLPREFSQFGITRFAADLFEAPRELKHFFCEASNLHRVPICPENVDIDNVSKMLSHYQMRLFLTASQRVSINVSRYSGETVTQMSPLRNNAGILSCHDGSKWPSASRIQAADAKLKEKEHEIHETRQELEEKKREIDVKRNGHKQEMTHWRNKKQTVETVKNGIMKTEMNLKRARQDKPDVEEAKRAYEETKERLEKKEKARINSMIKYIVEQKKAMVRYLSIAAVTREVENAYRKAREEKEELYVEWQDQKKELEIDSRELNVYKNRVGISMATFQKDAELSTNMEDKMNASEMKKWKEMNKSFAKEKLPDTYDDLRAEEENEKGRIKCVQNDGDKEDVTRLEFLMKEKEKLEQELVDQASYQRNRREKMEELIDKWMEPVAAIVSKINTNYGEFFERLGHGCGGEIDLDKPEDKTKMTEYGIKIMVKFREGERLRRLDHQVQSGGERSVSTMLYLLALQEECPVPFRCVDEINQGMDPTNERKVFDVMVEKLSGSGNLGRSQYFLLTPKLLSGLKFTKAVTLQIVHNAASLDRNAHKWDAAAFLERMRKDKREREAAVIAVR
ncbi:hypothetical protein PFISCL1PPCAC_5691, partial [Pristionchus fissidentatus]